jgi:hypothetical protein
MVMVKAWPQKRSNELNIALVVRLKGWPQKRKNEYCIGSIQKTLAQKDSLSVKDGDSHFISLYFFFQKPSSSNAKFKLV